MYMHACCVHANLVHQISSTVYDLHIVSLGTDAPQQGDLVYNCSPPGQIIKSFEHHKSIDPKSTSWKIPKNCF